MGAVVGPWYFFFVGHKSLGSLIKKRRGLFLAADAYPDFFCYAGPGSFSSELRDPGAQDFFLKGDPSDGYEPPGHSGLGGHGGPHRAETRRGAGARGRFRFS